VGGSGSILARAKDVAPSRRQAAEEVHRIIVLGRILCPEIEMRLDSNKIACTIRFERGRRWLGSVPDLAVVYTLVLKFWFTSARSPAWHGRHS
jgi:hypothetical protein